MRATRGSPGAPDMARSRTPVYITYLSRFRAFSLAPSYFDAQDTQDIYGIVAVARALRCSAYQSLRHNGDHVTGERRVSCTQWQRARPCGESDLVVDSISHLVNTRNIITCGRCATCGFFMIYPLCEIQTDSLVKNDK